MNCPKCDVPMQDKRVSHDLGPLLGLLEATIENIRAKVCGRCGERLLNDKDVDLAAKAIAGGLATKPDALWTDRERKFMREHRARRGSWAGAGAGSLGGGGADDEPKPAA